MLFFMLYFKWFFKIMAHLKRPVAEFNIYVDPDAAQIVFGNKELQGKIVLIPLEVTHTARLSKEILERIQPCRSKFRQLLVDIGVYFAGTYSTVFGLSDGPPLHDVVAMAYVALGEADFTQKAMYGYVVRGDECRGQTVCDFYNRDSTKPKNIIVATKVKVCLVQGKGLIENLKN